jgi:hypothetical protein
MVNAYRAATGQVKQRIVDLELLSAFDSHSVRLGVALVSDPVAWTCAKSRGPVVRICKCALLQRQTPAPNALRQALAKARQLSDPLVDPPRPTPGYSRPIRLAWHALVRKFVQLLTDLLKRQSHLLGEHYKRYSPKHSSLVLAVS